MVMDKAETPRSYVVKTEEGKLLRRNRKHLMKQEEQLPEPDMPITYSLSEERHTEPSEGDGTYVEIGEPADAAIAEGENKRISNQPGIGDPVH